MTDKSVNVRERDRCRKWVTEAGEALVCVSGRTHGRTYVSIDGPERPVVFNLTLHSHSVTFFFLHYTDFKQSTTPYVRSGGGGRTGILGLERPNKNISRAIIFNVEIVLANTPTRKNKTAVTHQLSPQPH